MRYTYTVLIKTGRHEIVKMLIRLGQNLHPPHTVPIRISWKYATLCLPFMLYGLTLIVPLPSSLLHLAYFGAAGLVIPLGVLLWLAFSRSSWLGDLASLTLTLGLFALPLCAVWAFLVHGNSTALYGGLLPTSDAGGYLNDAFRFLDGFFFQNMSIRRPLYAASLATVLWLTGQNLQATLAIYVALIAVACWLLAREVQSSYGVGAGVIVLILLYIYCRRFGNFGETMTETLGLALGALGFMLVWHGGRKRRMAVIWLGILLLTLGLNVRAGAFLALPALILGGTLTIRCVNRSALKYLIGSAAATGLGFAINLFISKVTVDPNVQVPFGNFSYVLYALAAGGAPDYRQVLFDYPGLGLTPTKIYSLAFELIRSNPAGLVQGCLTYWSKYIPNVFKAFYFFNDTSSMSIVQTCCYILSLLGLMRCILHRRELHYALLMSAVFGVFLSIPFASLAMGGHRIYAATMPVVIVLIASGLRQALEMINPIWSKIKGNKLPVAHSSDEPHDDAFFDLEKMAIGFGIGMILFLTAGPLFIRMTTHTPQITETPCPQGQDVLYGVLRPGISFNVVDDLVTSQARVPYVTENYIQNQIVNLTWTEIIPELSQHVTSGTTTFNVSDLSGNNPSFVTVRSDQVPSGHGKIRVCGKRAYTWYFYADSMQMLK